MAQNLLSFLTPTHHRRGGERPCRNGVVDRPGDEMVAPAARIIRWECGGCAGMSPSGLFFESAPFVPSLEHLTIGRI